MNVSRFLVGVVVLGACCGSPKKVNSFDVQPRTACPGNDVTLTWDVSGKTTLSTLPIASGSHDPQPTADDITAAAKPDDPKVSRKVTVTKTTWFVVRALDAKQAKDPWEGAKYVDVPVNEQARGGETNCTGNTCTATFNVDSKNSGARVIRISEPTISVSGGHVDGKVCITHGTMQAKCIGAGEAIEDQVLPLEGPWTLETTFPGQVPDSWPKLTVKLQIGCP